MEEKTNGRQLPNLTLVADSQGRDIAACLNESIGEKFRVSSHIFSGGELKDITAKMTVNNDLSTELKQFGKEDWVILIGGCNNIDGCKDPRLTCKNLIKILEKQVNSSQHTNLIVSTLPYRYDLHPDDARHLTILEINGEIRKLADSTPDVHLLDLYFLERFYHDKKGYHINQKGKKVVSKFICDIVFDKPETKLSSNKQLKLGENIKVVDKNMSSILKKLKSNPDVAFAHTISGDFGHPRHMTAGVAVKFKQEFGRPTPRNCVTGHLAFQKVENGAGIYSLITKLNYFGKPNLTDYRTSLSHLLTDFKNKGFKHLICSPMGCIRDKIPLQIFVKEIVKFQEETKANVEIITYDQHSTRVLRNGLDHRRFIDKLRILLHQEAKNVKIFQSGGEESTTDDATSNNCRADNPTAGNDTTITSQLVAEVNMSQSCETSPWRGWPSPPSTPLLQSVTSDGSAVKPKQSKCGSEVVVGAVTRPTSTPKPVPNPIFESSDTFSTPHLN